MFPKKLYKKLEERKANNAFRKLGTSSDLVDFSSNDYLGFSNSQVIFENVRMYLDSENNSQNGATGSRLLSGNHELYSKLETTISKFHNTESALVFNSGYDANIGFFSSVPQRGDVILYDEYSHASIRDGIQLSNAKAYKFRHNDLENLEEKMLRFSQNENTEIYIITESVFSMDGDSPQIQRLSELSKKYNAHLIIDEAHAVGIFGQGLVNFTVFARIITFGKALGCHGAAILGSQELKDYLINFSRSLIYTTALPPHSVATIICAYGLLTQDTSTTFSIKESPIRKLLNNIAFFKSEINRLSFQTFPLGEISAGKWGFIKSNSAIHSCIISGNDNVKKIAFKLQEKDFNVKPILSPTVLKDQERLRFCLHSYNSRQEITQVLELLATFDKVILN